MKKAIIAVLVAGAILGSVSPSFAATSRRYASIGINFGGSSIFGSINGYHFGAEFAYRFKERIAVRAEFVRAFSKSSFASSGPYYSSSDTIKYTLIPADISFLYIMRMSKDFSAYIGLGGGYYSLTIDESSVRSDLSNEPLKIEKTYNLKAWAPHVCLGLEGDIAKRFGIFGEAKYFVAKDKLAKNEEGSFSTEQDFIFGGPQLKIGIRFYF